MLEYQIDVVGDKGSHGVFQATEESVPNALREVGLCFEQRYPGEQPKELEVMNYRRV